ncbi:MAG: ATP-dependent metallopeptidase FtsH/Yme1/Tma family protein, partial [Actinomycetota bacterium]
MADDKTPKRNRWTPDGGSGGPGGSGAPRPRFSPWLVLPLLLLAFLVFNTWAGNAGTVKLNYSDFVKHVEAGDLTGTLSIGSTDISGTFKGDGGEETRFSTSLSTNFQSDTEFRDFLDEHDVAYEFTSPSVFTSLLLSILPFALVMVLIYYFVFKRMGGGANAALNLGRNKVKIYDRKEMKTSFNDVAGVDEAKEELLEVVDFLKNPKKYQRLGGRIP